MVPNRILNKTFKSIIPNKLLMDFHISIILIKLKDIKNHLSYPILPLKIRLHKRKKLTINKIIGKHKRNRNK